MTLKTTEEKSRALLEQIKNLLPNALVPIGTILAWLKSLLPSATYDRVGPDNSTAPDGTKAWSVLFSFDGQDLIDIGMIEGVNIYWNFELRRVNVLGSPTDPAQLKMVMDGDIESTYSTTSESYINYSHTITTAWTAATDFVVWGWSDNDLSTRHNTEIRNNTFGFAASSIPDGWVECNGQTLDDDESVYDGLVIPDLNGSSGTERFLRGQISSGGIGGTETHTHSISKPGAEASGGGATGYTGQAAATASQTSTLPSYYEVVWIMRIK